MNPHQLLVAHIKAILQDAENKEFHDFENQKYATPKVELFTQLENIIKNVKSGAYDN